MDDKTINVNELKEWIENWFYKNKYYHPYSKRNSIPITELYDILDQISQSFTVTDTGTCLVIEANEKG